MIRAMPTPAAERSLRAAAPNVLLAGFVCVMQVQGTMARVVAEPAAVGRPLADLGHLGYLLLVVSGAVLAVRHRFPVVVLVTTAAASVTYYLLDFPDGPGWLGLFVALYTATAYGDGRRSLMITGTTIAVLAVLWLVAARDIEPRAAIGWVFFRIGASVMSAALGESVRTRRVIAAEAVTRAELAERTREEEARARVDEERLRMAREVHDTVAHAIAVINVQSGVTAHLLDKQPDRVRETLRTIEQTSARALREMRSVLGVVRGADDSRTPQPGVAQLEHLIAESRNAGLDIDFEHDPAAVDLPTAVDGAAYRIVQEALANVIRHVGPTRVAVGVHRQIDELRVRVTNQLPRTPRPRSGAGTGRGLVGMRERCRLLGGELEAGPTTGGGFGVTARLPLVPAKGAR
jgi:signal transduction histidine kinase